MVRQLWTLAQVACWPLEISLRVQPCTKPLGSNGNLEECFMFRCMPCVFVHRCCTDALVLKRIDLLVSPSENDSDLIINNHLPLLVGSEAPWATAQFLALASLSKVPRRWECPWERRFWMACCCIPLANAIICQCLVLHAFERYLAGAQIQECLPKWLGNCCVWQCMCMVLLNPILIRWCVNFLRQRGLNCDCIELYPLQSLRFSFTVPLVIDAAAATCRRVLFAIHGPCAAYRQPCQSGRLPCLEGNEYESDGTSAQRSTTQHSRDHSLPLIMACISKSHDII